jgi:hypothetical protein
MLLGGNFYNIKPQFGRQDGSYGWKVDWKGGFSDKQYNVSPLFINGQIRHIVPFGDQFIFGINNESLKICAVR